MLPVIFIHLKLLWSTQSGQTTCSWVSSGVHPLRCPRDAVGMVLSLVVHPVSGLFGTDLRRKAQNITWKLGPCGPCVMRHNQLCWDNSAQRQRSREDRGVLMVQNYLIHTPPSGLLFPLSPMLVTGGILMCIPLAINQPTSQPKSVYNVPNPL